MTDYPDQVKVFFLEPSDRERRWLRRYRSSNSEHKCAANGSYCQAMFALGEADILYTEEGYIDGTKRGDDPPHTDPRWPTRCASCGEPFSGKDAFQLFGKQIYTRLSDGFRCTLAEAPIGACWDAWWVHHRSKRRGESPVIPGVGSMTGDDGRSLVIRCPDGHEWMIDSRARNCTLPNDNTHHCWVRHGRPEDGTLHVDKAGNTCLAGAGSIQTANWHGFLHHGVLHK